MIGQVDSVLYGDRHCIVSTSLLHGNHWEGEIRAVETQQILATETSPATVDFLSSGPAFHLYCGASAAQWLTRNKTLALACDDGDVRILSLDQDPSSTHLAFLAQATLEDHDDIVSCLAARAAKLVSGSFDGTIKVWSLGDTRAPEASVGSYDGYVWDVCFRDANTVLSASQGGDLQLHDLRALGAPQIRANNSLGLASLALSVSPRDGNIVARGKESGTLDCLDLRKLGGQPLAEYAQLHGSAVHVVAFGPAGRCIASGGDDGKVRLSSLAQGTVDSVEVGHTDYVRALDWGAVEKESDCAVLMSGAWDSSVKAIKVKL